MDPFDLEIWYGERIAVLGGNGSGKSHFPRLLAAGGTDPALEHRPVGDVRPVPVRHLGNARLGSRVRPSWFAQTHQHPALLGRTLLEILHRGDEYCRGKPREEAARELNRYELARGGEQRFESLSEGSRRGSRPCCLSSAAPPSCCSTSPPTTWICSRQKRWRRGSRPSTARWSRDP